MISWKNATWGGRIKLLIFCLIPVIVLAVLVNACAYVTIHRSIAIVKDSVTGVTHYSMRIGGWPGAHRSYTPINSLGLPDDEFVGLVPKGSCTHVLLAGDSYTFGDATSSEFRWSTVLQRMTSAKAPGRCIRYFNIGVRNTTIDTTIARIHQVMPLIDPDVVILGQYQNDLTDLANPGSPAWVPAVPGKAPDSHWGTRLARMVPGYNNSIVRFATYQAFAYMIRNDKPYDVLKTWSVLENEWMRDYANKLKGIYRDLYSGLVTEMRAKNIDFVVLTFPSKMDLLAQRAPEEAYFGELAREFNVPALSLMPALDANRRGMPYYMYDGHLSEFGNRVVAEAVWKWLFTSDPAPSSALHRAASGVTPTSP